MAKFSGNFAGFKKIIDTLGFSGKWKDILNGKQYRTDTGAIVNWYESTGTLIFQGNKEARKPFESRLIESLEDPIEITKRTESDPKIGDHKKVFVVHGHDNTSREQLELILHKLGLDPFVLANTGGGGLTIIEALEKEIGPEEGKARFGIVLLTPDDKGYAVSDGEVKMKFRARQNVVLEMGMLIAAIKRENVVILKKGDIEVPSDANGIIYIPYEKHVKETAPRLIDRLNVAGFTFTPSQVSKASIF